MSIQSTSSLLEQLQWRYATKQFDPVRKITDADWAGLEQALILTPSSYGLQPWHFYVITDPSTKEKFVPASWGQKQPVECSHFVVMTAKTGMEEADIDLFLKRTVEIRGGSVEQLAGYRGMMIGDLIQGPRSKWVAEWAARQAYIALGNFMTSAALLGIDTCPMEGIDPVKYNEILGLEGSGYATVVACPAGYRAEGDKYASLAKVRYSADQVITRI